MNTRIAIVALILLALNGCGESGPESKLDDVNALLAKNIPMNEAQRSKVDQFVSEGKRLLQNGKKDESSQAFTEALKVLKLAEDADMFNKSE